MFPKKSVVMGELPQVVRDWCFLYNAWIVGSGVDWIMGAPDRFDVPPRDLDVIIPPQHWQSACRHITNSSKVRINAFGGLKVKIEKFSVDVWPAHIEDFVSIAHASLPGRVHKAVRLQPFSLLSSRNS